ncbi:hypothetical protein RhiirA1_455707 [Rhizophagus irregularis]|uniref:Uncharacterized protein n=1 Tax=Rhizophagus irregularis TaxID=588596 RepID=A0A2N0S2B7_9GLOM|nr:hypothetical protein RhiirA1_455707 [Rhizophagus irregularis]
MFRWNFESFQLPRRYFEGSWFPEQHFKGFWLSSFCLSGWNSKVFGFLVSIYLDGILKISLQNSHFFFNFEGFQPSGRSRTPKYRAPIWPNLQEIGSDLTNPIESQLRFGQSYRKIGSNLDTRILQGNQLQFAILQENYLQFVETNGN